MQPPALVAYEHTRLPDRDGHFAGGVHPSPQNTLLTGSLLPRLQQLHPDGLYCTASDFAERLCAAGIDPNAV